MQFSLLQGTQVIANDFVNGSQQETVAPFGSETITAVANQTVTGLILPTSPDIGSLGIEVDMGSFFSTGLSSEIQAIGSVQITYTYEPTSTTPEPGGLWLAGCGVLSVLLFRAFGHRVFDVTIGPQ